MNKQEAERRAERLRGSNRDRSVTYQAEPEHVGGNKYVVRKFRHDHPTGTVFYI